MWRQRPRSTGASDQRHCRGRLPLQRARASRPPFAEVGLQHGRVGQTDSERWPQRAVSRLVLPGSRTWTGCGGVRRLASWTGRYERSFAGLSARRGRASAQARSGVGRGSGRPERRRPRGAAPVRLVISTEPEERRRSIDWVGGGMRALGGFERLVRAELVRRRGEPRGAQPIGHGAGRGRAAPVGPTVVFMTALERGVWTYWSGETREREARRRAIAPAEGGIRRRVT